MGADTLSERYERTMARIEQISQEGYQVIIQCECELDEAGMVNQKPELLTHPVVELCPIHSPDALYVGRTEAMRLHYKARENGTINYVDVMSLYPYICKNNKFPNGYPIIHVGNACKNKEACLQMDGLINVRLCLREICVILSHPTEATIHYCFVFAGHAFTNGTFPVNASILEVMREPLRELGFWTRFD